MTIFEIFMYSAFCLTLVFEDIRLFSKTEKVSVSRIVTYVGIFIGFTLGAIGKVTAATDWTNAFYLLGFALSGIALEFSFYIRRGSK